MINRTKLVYDVRFFLMIIYKNCSYAKLLTLERLTMTFSILFFNRRCSNAIHAVVSWRWTQVSYWCRFPRITRLFTAAHCCFKHQLVNPPARPAVYDGSVKTWIFLVFVKGMRTLSVCERQSYLGWKRNFNPATNTMSFFCVPTCSDIACMYTRCLFKFVFLVSNYCEECRVAKTRFVPISHRFLM